MPSEKMRVDRWLWAVRIFKSRSKATNACKKGHIKIGELRLKPAALVRVGGTLTIKKDGFNLEFVIKALIPKRVSFILAEPCYENITPIDELNKFKDWFIGKAPPELRAKGACRPTKRERRDLESFKDEVYLDDWFDDSDS